MGLNVGDINISISGSADGIVNYGKAVLFRDMLLVLQLDEDTLNLINDTGELHDKVNSILILQLPIEKSLEEFHSTLVKLIRYIIYHNENIDIVYDALWVCSSTPEHYNLSVSAVTENQKKITKNQYKIFPKVEKTCFRRSFSDLNFTFSAGENTSYFAEPSGPDVTTVESELLPLDYDIHDGWKYIEVYPEPDPEDEESGTSSGGSDVPLEPIGYKRIDTKETYTLDLRGMYSQIMGYVAASVTVGNIVVTATRIVNPDIYGKVQD